MVATRMLARKNIGTKFFYSQHIMSMLILIARMYQQKEL
jgi:hypothetical protein